MKKPEKNQGFNGIRTRDLRDTGAMLYQLSYEATLIISYTIRHFTPFTGKYELTIDLAPYVWLHSSVGKCGSFDLNFVFLTLGPAQYD